MDHIIDLRSDTVTQPCRAMRKVMADADVGDDVYGDDPTVNTLEEFAADLLGFESAVFAASGTQANLIGLLSHCNRGDEYIVGQQAHTYKYEGGGAAVLGSIQPQPIEFEEDSTLDLNKVAEKIKPDDVHFARTKLLCLENSQNGKPLPLHYLKDAAEFTKEKKLKLHLDGARLFNAVVEQGVSVKQITQNFDSATLCLSKGLGAPVGSLLCGDKDFIAEARKWRKMCGGGMRQAGILAAAGMFALQNNIERLSQDHENAKALTAGLRKFKEIELSPDSPQTNMVFYNTSQEIAQNLGGYLKRNKILISSGPKTRLVTHLGIQQADIPFVLEKIEEFFKQNL